MADNIQAASARAAIAGMRGIGEPVHPAMKLAADNPNFDGTNTGIFELGASGTWRSLVKGADPASWADGLVRE